MNKLMEILDDIFSWEVIPILMLGIIVGFVISLVLLS